VKNGAILEHAAADKEMRYHDLVASPLAELVVLACETGGKGQGIIMDLMETLAKTKAANMHAPFHPFCRICRSPRMAQKLVLG